MTKRILTLLLALLLLFALCLPAAAFPTSFLGGDDDADEAEEHTFIHDNAGLLKDRERSKLEDAAEELAGDRLEYVQRSRWQLRFLSLFTHPSEEAAKQLIADGKSVNLIFREGLRTIASTTDLSLPPDQWTYLK